MLLLSGEFFEVHFCPSYTNIIIIALMLMIMKMRTIMIIIMTIILVIILVIMLVMILAIILLMIYPHVLLNLSLIHPCVPIISSVPHAVGGALRVSLTGYMIQIRVYQSFSG